MPHAAYEALSARNEMAQSFSQLEIQTRTAAISDLVRVAQVSLVANQTETTAVLKIADKARTYEAFFSAPGLGVINLASIGLPESPDPDGLFISINYRDDSGIKNLIFLETTKMPEAVGEREVDLLSRFTPEQLLQIAQLISTASPISRKKYYSYFRKSKFRSGLEKLRDFVSQLGQKGQ